MTTTAPTVTAPALDLSLLEPLLRDMVQLVGLQATLAIVRQHGGTRLWFPNDPKPESPMVALVGIDNARRLCLHFGADRPTIPKAQAALQALRDADIRDNPQGLSVPQLTRKHGLTERRVYQIRGEPAPDAGQAGLFSE